jgi:hypothetical protein
MKLLNFYLGCIIEECWHAVEVNASQLPIKVNTIQKGNDFMEAHSFVVLCGINLLWQYVTMGMK